MDILSLMKERLAGLNPVRMDIRDDSAAHAGHAGAAAGGGHFQLYIVSDIFNGKSAIERHRMIYAALGDLFPNAIHALNIVAKTSQGN